VIQNVDAVADRNPRTLQVPERRRNGPLGKVMPRVVVESDDQDARVVPADGHDQVVQIGEVFVVPGQHRASLGDSPGQHASIADRRQANVGSKHNVMPSRPQPDSQAAAAHIFVDQDSHG
jgi:hypothetical protein